MKREVTTRDLRVFGLIWGIIFVIIAYNISPESANGAKWSIIFSCLSLASIFIAVANPRVFIKIKFYQTWIKIGNFLGKVNGFLISFILFYGIFAPVGIILRILKKDLLSKKLDRLADSYFIDRKSQPGDMKNQF